MNVVVDASVIVSALTDSGRDGIWAEGVLSAGELFSAELVMVETANILRRLERAKEISRIEANSAYEDHQRLPIELLPFAPFADRIWELRHSLTCYDAWYVAAAEALQMPFATLDRRLARSTGPDCEFLLP